MLDSIEIKNFKRIGGEGLKLDKLYKDTKINTIEDYLIKDKSAFSENKSNKVEAALVNIRRWKAIEEDFSWGNFNPRVVDLVSKVYAFISPSNK
ncbi:MAG: hypothetical protein WCK98_06960 [bacterium]